MAVSGILVGLTSAELTTLRTQYLAALTAIAQAQSYSIGGKQFTKADLATVLNMMGEINHALSLLNGTAHRHLVADFSNG